MTWDLELLLVIAVIASGVIYYGDRYRLRGKTRTAPPSWLVDTARTMFPMLLLVLVLRTFVAEPFRIPSESMLPTLEEGDLVLVDKYSYGLRLPVVHTKIVPAGQPARGDVVVFRFPPDPNIDYIKRVVGVPGDHIEYVGKRLRINGEDATLHDTGPYADPQPSLLFARAYRRFTTRIPGGTSHDLLIDSGAPSLAHRFVVPDGHYLVFGDNRDYSSDSRVWGFVPEEYLVGRAFFIWLNLDYLIQTFTDPADAAWSRLGYIE